MNSGDQATTAGGGATGGGSADLHEALRWIGLRVDDCDGASVGRLEDIWVDPVAGEPRWLLVKEGRFGGRHTLIPFGRASSSGGRVWVPFERRIVRTAAEVRPGSPLSSELEQQLLDHYARSAGTADGIGSGGGSPAPAPAEARTGEAPAHGQPPVQGRRFDPGPRPDPAPSPRPARQAPPPPPPPPPPPVTGGQGTWRAPGPAPFSGSSHPGYERPAPPRRPHAPAPPQHAPASPPRPASGAYGAAPGPVDRSYRPSPRWATAPPARSPEGYQPRAGHGQPAPQWPQAPAWPPEPAGQTIEIELSGRVRISGEVRFLGTPPQWPPDQYRG